MPPKTKKINSTPPQEKLAKLNAYIDDIAKVLKPGSTIGLSHEIMIEIATAYIECRVLQFGVKFGDPSDTFDYAIHLPKSSCKNGHGGVEGRPIEA